MRPQICFLFCLSRYILETRGENVNISTPGINMTSQDTETKHSPNARKYERGAEAQTSSQATLSTLWKLSSTAVPFLKNSTASETANPKQQLLFEQDPVPMISASGRQNFVTKRETTVISSTAATLDVVRNESDHNTLNVAGTGAGCYYNSTTTEKPTNDREIMETTSASESPTTSVNYHSSGTDTPTTSEIVSMAAFEAFLSLTTENITQCLETDGRLQFHALSGQISFFTTSSPMTQVHKCAIELLVPVDMGMDIEFSANSSSCNNFKLYHNNVYIACGSVTSQHIRIPKQNATLKFELKPHDAAQFTLTFNFSSIPRPQLEVNFTSATTGYVQSPGWNEKTKYPSLSDEWAYVHVPANHSIMVSFFRLYIEGYTPIKCQYDMLTISYETLSGTSQDVVLCNTTPLPKPEVFHTNNLSFHFVSDRIFEYSGFKLLFSFHHHSAVPEKTSSGLWNCSVAHWPQFQQHIGICNTIKECYAGEDEANCSHLYEGCEAGSISIGGKCYILVVDNGSITWNEAANDCVDRNSYLASLNTPDEWGRVNEFIASTGLQQIYFGLQATGSNFPELYRRGFQWSDGTVAYFLQVSYTQVSQACFFLPRQKSQDSYVLKMTKCDENVTTGFLCEKNVESIDTVPDPIRLQTEEWSGNDSHVICPAGHVAFKFLACDVKNDCWTSPVDSPGSCNAPMTPQPPSFECNNGVESVPYTLVCDHRPDCSDNSDEHFCSFPPCPNAKGFKCSNKQCVLREQHCDQIEQCLDGSDERQCSYSKSVYTLETLQTQRPPAVIDFDAYGMYTVKSLKLTKHQNNSLEPDVCPETHFLCPGKWAYCMPVFVRCNGVWDCPGREDEAGCDSYLCPGFYRCRASPICVHASHVCDGVFQCPLRDDELLCDLHCPVNCMCQGLAFFCSGPFPSEDFPQLRYLDVQGSAIKFEDLQTNTMLIYLNVAECGLTHITHVKFPNLRRLDLSRNRLKTIRAEDLKNMKKLKVLSLAGNPLTSLFVTPRDQDITISSLLSLDVSEITIATLNISIFSIFPRLLSLNLSGCDVERFTGEGFHSLAYLKYLNVEGCPIHDFPKDIFKGLVTLTEVWADNYKLCCPATLPDNFNMMGCHAPSDEISSCDALLRSDFYRVILSLFAVLALLGNVCSFVYRVFVNRVTSTLGFDAFVTHLCVSDFCMGVYLSIIGIADRLHMGTYLWNDTTWKNSPACKLAGFLSLLSSEVSAFIICLITLERFLVIRFPFSRLHFRKWSAHVACGIAWLVGVILAGIPLLPMTSHWEFYSQNGICIPLPITRNDFAGHNYSFVVMIIVNFVLFLLIAAGQVFIYWSVRTNSMTAGASTKKSQDLTIARRLITIAMSDFLCWFPIGLLGVLASTGVPIPGEVNVAVAIIILPVNSAINPFLYTINMLLERQKRAQEKRIQDLVMTVAANSVVDRLEDGAYTKREAVGLVKTWLSKGVLPLDSLETIIINEKEQRQTPKHPAE